MREINKKVYDVAGFEFDELEFEDGPPPIDGIELDKSNHSIDQILTDQQVQSTSQDSYNEEEFEEGALELDKKAEKLARRSGNQVLKASANRSNISVATNSNVNKSSKAMLKSSKAKAVSKPNRRKTNKKRSSNKSSKSIFLVLVLLIAIAAYFFQEDIFKLLEGYI